MKAVYVYGRYASMQYSDVRTKYVPATMRSAVWMNRRKGANSSADTNAEASILMILREYACGGKLPGNRRCAFDLCNRDVTKVPLCLLLRSTEISGVSATMN